MKRWLWGEKTCFLRPEKRWKIGVLHRRNNGLPPALSNRTRSGPPSLSEFCLFNIYYTYSISIFGIDIHIECRRREGNISRVYFWSDSMCIWSHAQLFDPAVLKAWQNLSVDTITLVLYLIFTLFFAILFTVVITIVMMWPYICSKVFFEDWFWPRIWGHIRIRLAALGPSTSVGAKASFL